MKINLATVTIDEVIKKKAEIDDELQRIRKVRDNFLNNYERKCARLSRCVHYLDSVKYVLERNEEE